MRRTGVPTSISPARRGSKLLRRKTETGGSAGGVGQAQQHARLPFETATTAAKFIITGTLDKVPKLEIVLPHSGGAFPYVAGRVDDGLVAAQFKLQRPFREYIRRFHYDTLTYYPETLRFLIDLVGSDRVVIGTDNFATRDVKEPNKLVEEINLPAAERDRILRGNAVRLLLL
jgi:aminocarboxymuconate-semialdehyde decarboxylase